LIRSRSSSVFRGNLDGKQNIPTSCESFGRIKFSSLRGKLKAPGIETGPAILAGFPGAIERMRNVLPIIREARVAAHVLSGHRQRQAIAIHYRHDFHAFSTLGWTDLRASALSHRKGRVDEALFFVQHPFVAKFTRPISDIRSSLDHLIDGLQEFVRDAEAERLGGLDVDANSNVVGCSTGNSAGSAPWKILST
jgi:hypothetical protein